MRKSLVAAGVLLVANLSILVATALPDPAVHVRREEPVHYIPISGAIVQDLQTCTKPIMALTTHQPNWSVRIEARWNTALTATITLDDKGARWRDGAFAQELELTTGERDRLLDALDTSCVPDGSRGGPYDFVVGYGAHVPQGSPAGRPIAGVFITARARYQDLRRPVTTDLGLRLEGTSHGAPVAVSVTTDDITIDETGHRYVHPLSSAARVDLLDWALELPGSDPSPDAFFGTLNVAGASRPIAVSRESFGKLTPGAQRYACGHPVIGAICHWSEL